MPTSPERSFDKIKKRNQVGVGCTQILKTLGVIEKDRKA